MISCELFRDYKLILSISLETGHPINYSRALYTHLFEINLIGGVYHELPHLPFYTLHFFILYSSTNHGPTRSSLRDQSHVSLEIINLLGEQVHSIKYQNLETGTHNKIIHSSVRIRPVLMKTLPESDSLINR
jgi:hypothetical protein